MSHIDDGVPGVAVHAGDDDGDYAETADVGGDLPIAIRIGSAGHAAYDEARVYLSRDLAIKLHRTLGTVLQADDRPTTPALLTAAKDLLQVINHEPIRAATIACGLPLYQKAAALIDAIERAEGRE